MNKYTILRGIVKMSFLFKSNRYKHLLGGLVIGLLSLSFYNAVYAGVIAGGCLEFKDKAWGGSWDWIDLACTVVGAVVGGMVWLF